MIIPGLGEVTHDKDFPDCLNSKPVAVPMLGGKLCNFVLEGYAEDTAQEDFQAAIAAFLQPDNRALLDAKPHIHTYYHDVYKVVGEELELPVVAMDDVLDHVSLGDTPVVSRNDEDGLVYLSLECSCMWEREHGLQIVFREGKTVNKVGPYDGHLTHDSDEVYEVVYSN